MKQFYQIHELAKLFDLCPDTLRYYEEKGLLHPVRGENRYRMYGIQDVCTLNIIRSLRELGIPTRSIRAYLERRSVGETLTLLDREEELLRRRMAELEAALKEAQNRRSRLEQYRNAAPAQKAGAAAPRLPEGDRQPVHGGGGGRGQLGRGHL